MAKGPDGADAIGVPEPAVRLVEDGLGVAGDGGPAAQARDARHDADGAVDEGKRAAVRGAEDGSPAELTGRGAHEDVDGAVERAGRRERDDGQVVGVQDRGDGRGPNRGMSATRRAKPLGIIGGAPCDGGGGVGLEAGGEGAGRSRGHEVKRKSKSKLHLFPSWETTKDWK